MFWKIIRKSDGAIIDKVWYIATMTAEEVYAAVEDDYDFEIRLLACEAD
jgi:hypothetical protein